MNGNEAVNKFKFIKRIKEIEEHRGIRPEDGIISVTFDFEKRMEYVTTVSGTWSGNGFKYIPYTIYYGDNTGTYASPNNATYTSYGRGSVSAMNLSTQNNSGITAQGSDISQQFGYGYIGQLKNKPTTISFKLIGFDETESNPQAVYTNDKLECKNCGLKSRNINKFCPRCGTILK